MSAWRSGMRGTAGKQLGVESRRLRASGTDVVIIQPTVHDLDIMGTNLMSSARRHDVIERGAQSVTDHLRESGIGERLADDAPAGRPGARAATPRQEGRVVAGLPRARTQALRARAAPRRARVAA